MTTLRSTGPDYGRLGSTPTIAMNNRAQKETRDDLAIVGDHLESDLTDMQALGQSRQMA